MLYGVVASVMAAHDDANQARRNVIVSHAARGMPFATSTGATSSDDPHFVLCIARTSVVARSVERTLRRIETARRPCTRVITPAFFSRWKTVFVEAEEENLLLDTKNGNIICADVRIRNFNIEVRCHT